MMTILFMYGFQVFFKWLKVIWLLGCCCCWTENKLRHKNCTIDQSFILNKSSFLFSLTQQKIPKNELFWATWDLKSTYEEILSSNTLMSFNSYFWLFICVPFAASQVSNIKYKNVLTTRLVSGKTFNAMLQY